MRQANHTTAVSSVIPTTEWRISSTWNKMILLLKCPSRECMFLFNDGGHTLDSTKQEETPVRRRPERKNVTQHKQGNNSTTAVEGRITMQLLSVTASKQFHGNMHRPLSANGCRVLSATLALMLHGQVLMRLCARAPRL